MTAVVALFYALSLTYSKSQREFFAELIPASMRRGLREMFAEDYNAPHSSSQPDECDAGRPAEIAGRPAVCRDVPRAARVPGRVDDHAAEFEDAQHNGTVTAVLIQATAVPVGIDTGGKLGRFASTLAQSSEKIQNAASHCRPGCATALPSGALPIVQRWRQVQDLWWACGRKLAQRIAGKHEKCKDGLRRGDPRIKF